MIIVIVRFHNPKIHLVQNPQVVLFTTYDPHLVRIHLVRKIFSAIFRTKWGPPVLIKTVIYKMLFLWNIYDILELVTILLNEKLENSMYQKVTQRYVVCQTGLVS